MGAKISVEEITEYTDRKIEEMESKIVSELKPEVKEIYDRRVEEIQQRKAATSMKPASDRKN